MAITMIVGLSATGKSTLSKQLAAAHTGRCLFHLDENIHMGDDRAVDDWVARLLPYREKYDAIVEGCMGYRVMLRWLQIYGYVPQHIIMATCNRNVRYQRHLERGTKVPTMQDIMILAAHRQWEYLLNSKRLTTKIETYDSSMY